MIEAFERPFTAAERELLARAPGFAPRWGTGMVGGLGVGVIAFLVLLLALSFRTDGAEVAAPGAVAGAALTSALYYGWRQRKERRDWADQGAARAAALASGRARVTRYQAVDAIAVQESEDEGIGFYLQLRDGRVLYLGGQYLYEPADARRFPATEFEVSRVATTGLFLGLSPGGPYLPPSSYRGPFTDDEYHRGQVPEDESLVERPFVDLRGTAG